MIFNLFKIFISNIFSFTSLFEGFKKGWKGIIKSILLLLLIIYAYGLILFFYSITMIAAYKYMAAQSITYLMPVLSTITALCIIIFLGITSVAGNYYTGCGEEQIISMPITTTQFFGAKFAVSFCTDAVIGFILFAISSFIYGYNEHLLAKPMFYLGFLITAITISIIAIAVIYLVLILILYICPCLRKKSFMSAVSSFIIIVFAFCYGFINSRISSSISDLSQMDIIIHPLTDVAGKMYSVKSLFSIFTGALNGKILPILILLAVSAIIIFLLVPVMGKIYLKTLNGFSDIKTRKLSAEKVNVVMKKEVHSSSAFKALYLRDVRTVLREPTFFANGPLMVFLFPIIMIISVGFALASNSSSNIFTLLDALKTKLGEMSPESYSDLKFYITLAITAMALFEGNFSQTASSAFSREGKALYDLKAMPVENQLIVKVKFWHAMTYIFISIAIMSLILLVVNCVLGGIFSPLEILEMIFSMILVVIPVSILLIFVDMFIDTAKPKLQWENPIAAYKQNMNNAVSIFISMGIIFVIGILIAVVLPKSIYGFLIITVIFTILSAPLGVLYFRYAEKRITTMQ